MESSFAWIEYLNISPASLDAWKAEAPEDIPLLVWCLKEGKIAFKDYAKWAKNHYSLPVVRHEFFSNHLPLNEVDQRDWSPWMVPVGTWEGLTYIGCVIPPPDPEEGCVYLLADPVDLYKVYSQLEETSISQKPEEEPVTEETTFHQMPDGLILDLKSPMAPPMEPENALSIPEPPHFENEVPMVAPAESDSNVPTAPEGLTLILKTPEEPAAPQPAAPQPAAPQPAAPQPAAPPSHLKNSKSVIPENALAGWWSEAKNIFTHAVLLKVAGDHFDVMWKDGQSLSAPSLSIKNPSLFRIALRTGKPYHGFVVENEIHSQFFESIGVRGYPSSVTALLVDGTNASFIISFFGFIGKEGMELSLAEALSQQLATSLRNVPGTTQAA